MVLANLLVTLLAALAVLIPPLAAYESSRTVVNDISSKMGDIMMFPNYYVDPDMDNFWDPEYKVQNVRQGCLAVCAMRALRLIYRDGRINVANVRRFIASNNADPTTSWRLEKMFMSCHQSSGFMQRTCSAGLAALRCYRATIEQLGWAPGSY
ncbi:PREDICTED: pheromone-binding protein-like isoform X2 [Papilio polytes]|uniref:pheromone-binding protein-like isoform X2 n=1 Tax=Papilio polytes TaxID=76194 RepID=UPI00067649AB|nr:PREDICTED: pheromone-binding protein-like isoform X2 [Papilio polytes]